MGPFIEKFDNNVDVKAGFFAPQVFQQNSS